VCKPYLVRLPAILRRRLKLGSFAYEQPAALKALVEHYRLSDRYYEMLRGTKGLSPENSAGAVFWRSLAQLLMLDFIPVFQPKLSEADKHLLSDWIDAGGTLETFMDDPARHQHFYQAQLVCLLQEQARLKGRSLAWMFRWFANKEETQGLKGKEKRNSLLPRPYRRRLTAESLKQAYNSIPRPVREKPYDYLPFVGLGPAPARLT
jgi:hypothetical protein